MAAKSYTQDELRQLLSGKLGLSYTSDNVSELDAILKKQFGVENDATRAALIMRLRQRDQEFNTVLQELLELQAERSKTEHRWFSFFSKENKERAEELASAQADLARIKQAGAAAVAAAASGGGASASRSATSSTGSTANAAQDNRPAPAQSSQQVQSDAVTGERASTMPHNMLERERQEVESEEERLTKERERMRKSADDTQQELSAEEKKVGKLRSAAGMVGTAAAATGNVAAGVASGAASMVADAWQRRAEGKAQRAQERSYREERRAQLAETRSWAAPDGKRKLLLAFAFFLLLWGGEGDSWLGLGDFSVFGLALTTIIGITVLFMFLLSKRFQKEFFCASGLGFLLFLIVHLWLSSIGFQYGLGYALLFLGLSFIAWLFFAFTTGRISEQRNLIIKILLLSTIIYALPGVVGEHFPMFGEKVISLIHVLVMLVPVGVLFMLAQMADADPEGYAAGLLHYYRAILFLFFVIFIVYGLVQAVALLPKDYVLPGRDTGESKETVIQMIQDKGTVVWQRLSGTYKKATDPGAYYTGQVEQNKQKPLGVTITNLRSQDKKVNNQTPIVVFGGITARSFIGESIAIAPSCVILDKKGMPEAWVDPIQVDVIYGTSKSFECTFSPAELRMAAMEWPRGSYSVSAMATFPFQTWAYIPYTFVDEERARTIARQGKDVRTVLSIEETPVATYTSGPITLGMGGTSQPILLRPDDETQIVPPGTFLGITVDNTQWAKGELRRVDTIELKVPRPLRLASCDRNWSDGDPVDDRFDELYRDYRFVNPSMDPLVTYTSITCQLTVLPEDRDVAMQLVSQEKAVRSFIGVVNYTYTVNDKITVQVG